MDTSLLAHHRIRFAVVLRTLLPALALSVLGSQAAANTLNQIGRAHV